MTMCKQMLYKMKANPTRFKKLSFSGRKRPLYGLKRTTLRPVNDPFAESAETACILTHFACTLINELMTREELMKLPLRWVSHLSMEEEHQTCYRNDQYGITIVCVTPMRDGYNGKSRKWFRYEGMEFGTMKGFLDYFNASESEREKYRLEHDY